MVVYLVAWLEQQTAGRTASRMVERWVDEKDVSSVAAKEIWSADYLAGNLSLYLALMSELMASVKAAQSVEVSAVEKADYWVERTAALWASLKDAERAASKG